MNREFLLNLIFLVCINLLIKPFYIFGIDRTVQNTVAPGDYGIYFALFNFTFLFQIINDFGIQNFNNRNIAQYNQLLDKYLPNILVLKGLLALLYLSVVFVAAWISGYQQADFHLLLFIALNQIFLSLLLYMRSNISGLALYRIDSIISVLEKMLLIIVCSVLLWVEPFSSQFKIEWFIYAQTSTLFLTSLIAFLIVRRRLQQLRFSFNLPFLLLILRKSYPYAFVIFLMTIYSRIDAVMIERMLPLGKIEADIYASAFRLLDASNMLGFLLAGLLLPMFSKMIKDKAPVDQLVSFSFQIILAASTTLAAATFFFQQEIMETLYVDGGPYSGRIMGYLILSFIAVSGTYIYGTLLTASGALRALNIISFSGVILNIVLNLFLIPKYKALGASVATCVTQFTIWGIQIITAYQILKLPYSPVWIFRLLLYVASTFGLSYSIFTQFTFPWFANFCISLCTGMLLAFIFRLIRIQSILQLVVNKKKETNQIK